ncbi:hypothetical protein AAD018_009040 [Aestuariibius insulae]|uniref:hypothetical protein n=1 Tax=Aestuariibius insulae TaxID=2058287 RepID=UPI00345EB61C
MKKSVAYFMERKATFADLHDAMDWVATEASGFGMTGPEAEAKGYAYIAKSN